jgi:hypothetical protein
VDQRRRKASGENRAARGTRCAEEKNVHDSGTVR